MRLREGAERLVARDGMHRLDALVLTLSEANKPCARMILTTLARRGALTIELTVSSHSSYLSFLEGYARALATVETRAQRARSWLSDALGAMRPEFRFDAKLTGRVGSSAFAVSIMRRT